MTVDVLTRPLWTGQEVARAVGGGVDMAGHGGCVQANMGGGPRGIGVMVAAQPDQGRALRLTPVQVVDDGLILGPPMGQQGLPQVQHVASQNIGRGRVGAQKGKHKVRA